MSSRSRHPSVAWRPNLERCRSRLAELLAEEGASWPEVAAGAIVARGASGMSVEEWASSLGVSRDVVEATESGERAP